MTSSSESDQNSASSLFIKTSMTIARNIRLVRERQRMSQAELANKVDVAQAQISRWESPRHIGYTLSGLSKIAFALDVTVVDLVTETKIEE